MPLEVHGSDGVRVERSSPQATCCRQLLLCPDVAVRVGGVWRQAVQIRSAVETSPAHIYQSKLSSAEAGMDPCHAAAMLFVTKRM